MGGQIGGTRGENILRGTLDMIILKLLEERPGHGYAITQRMRRATAETISVEEGSLYPALHKLEKQGFVVSEWRISDRNRRAKVYSLTDDGRDHLEKKIMWWSRFSQGMTAILSARRHFAIAN